MNVQVTRKKDPAVLAAQIMTGLAGGMLDVGHMVSQRARNKAPVDTGRLARSIHASEPRVVGPLAMAVDVGTNVVYAAAHEFGSGVHAEDPAKRELILIEAGFWTGKSTKKALHFRWPGHFRPIYATRARSKYPTVYPPAGWRGTRAHGTRRRGRRRRRGRGPTFGGVSFW